MHHDPRTAARKSGPRRAWLAPRIARIRAGDAENGSLNIVTDAVFTFTS